MIALDRVAVSSGGRLAGVTLAVGRGGWTTLIGPNGAGKSTLLRAVAGLVPHRGAVAVDGRDLRSAPARARARLLASVPQSPLLPPDMTVGEYVLLGRTPHVGTFSRESRHDRLAAALALARLDLGGYEARRLETLSGGEKQRAVVARALAQDARIVLLDEPMAALDIGHQQQALELLDGLRAESGLTLVAAMHDLTLAAQYADRMLLLDHGRLAADGIPGDVVTEDAIARHYGAAIRIVTLDGAIAVIPSRARREHGEG